MVKKLPKIGMTFLICFLFTFMLFIFGPSEIFFVNVTGFKFVYGDFGGYMAVMALAAAVILTAAIAFMPDKIHGILLSIVFGISIAGYIQVMFLNKNLDLLGVTQERYSIHKISALLNLILWFAIIAGAVIFFFKKDIWKKLVSGLSAFLLCIQLVALVFLLISADESAYKHPEHIWHLSGEDQYTVSADKNVIVLILDFFSNQYLAYCYDEYPDATDFLHDFTYYSNMDCAYFGTFPSLPHMLTGRELNMSQSVNDWCADIWKSEETNAFYRKLAENNFKFNVYTPEINILCGLNDAQMLNGMISNITDDTQDIAVNHKLLFKTMIKMSAYRMFPEILKTYFYADVDEYEDIVYTNINKIYHKNSDFYHGLLDNGLHVDETANYVIFQHLMGPHYLTTDANGEYKEYASLAETVKGCMVIVEEYLNQLKQLGVYDDATIIITADHGDVKDSQVIFYIKEPGETHEVSPVTNAPASFNEFMPTIAKAAGLDASDYGQTIFDFTQDELRERTVWVRKNDSGYPQVPCYTGLKNGDSNVYYGYTYTGDIEDLLNKTSEGPSIIVPMVDSYF